jgi:hypothetical protein
MPSGIWNADALGAYRKANRIKLDCWPTAAVLAHMRGQER